MEKKLLSGSIQLEVKYTIKKVKSKSTDLMGVITQKGDFAHFDLSVPIMTFKSGDKDFDNHLQSVTDVTIEPIARASGQCPWSVFEADKSSCEAQIHFHGVTKNYLIQLEKKGARASLILDLEAHKIIRPSLLGIKIKNEVLIQCELNWT